MTCQEWFHLSFDQFAFLVVLPLDVYVSPDVVTQSYSTV